jgi:MFS family permease
MAENSLIRALRHRNYRLFFSGQSISLIGTWLTRVATSWLVFKLSNSAWILGVVSFAGQIPTFLLAPVAGVLVDRWSRHPVMIVTQILSMIQSGLLAILTLTGQITVESVLALSVLQGLINAFDTPARQAFVVDLVEDRADLPNAIALNSSMVNMAKLLGPSAAGILIASIGIGWCFGVDALSYIAVIFSLCLMRVKPRERLAPNGKRIHHELWEGMQYALAFRPIRAILVLLALVSLMGTPYMVLLPIVVSKQLHGNALMLGYLTAASGMGALAGVVYLASRSTVLGLGRIIPMAAMVFGVGLIGLGISSWFWLSFALMFVTGLGMMLNMASSNTVLQTIVEEDKRGRVMSLYTMAVFGMLPFGSLFSGSLASRIGSGETLMLGGVCCILGGILFLSILPDVRRQIRPIYLQLGLLPNIADNLPQAPPLAMSHDD